MLSLFCSTIVSIFATENDLADDVTYLQDSRSFIPRETLLPVLRKDISGNQHCAKKPLSTR